MSDLVQGVKLKFELPFTLPVPVSFPFESIGDFRPITRIPKYDYALEKRIMKDIKRQKQEDQFSMLRQAQQQLSMVDLIASRKTRHKGKEPERKSMAVVPSIGAGSLLKPSSEGGVGRQQGDTAVRPSSSSSAVVGSEWPQSQQHARKAPDTRVGLAPGEATALPVDAPAIALGQQVERPHSAGPGVPVAHSAAHGQNAGIVASYPQPTLVAAGTAAPVAGPSTGPVAAVSQTQHAGPAVYAARPPPPPRAQLSGPYMSGIQDAYLAPRPANAPFGVGVRPGAGVQPQATAAPPSLGLGFGYPGVVRPSPGQQRPQPQPPAIQHQLRPQQTALPHQQPQPSLRADQHPAAHNPRFSTSFGMGSGAPGAAQMLQAAAAMRPALPPKPDEWKPQVDGPAGAPAAPASRPQQQQPPPVPPRRNYTPQGPAPPALPPKPFEAFSEFDYATGAPGSMGSSDSAGHVEQLNLLLGMGFSQPQAIHALEMYDYDVNQASNYLIDKAS